MISITIPKRMSKSMSKQSILTRPRRETTRRTRKIEVYSFQLPRVARASHDGHTERSGHDTLGGAHTGVEEPGGDGVDAGKVLPLDGKRFGEVDDG
jgi:hypothetical protein